MFYTDSVYIQKYTEYVYITVRVNNLIRIFIFSIIFLVSCVAVEEYGKWIPASNNTYPEIFSKPIAVAKEWAESNIDAEKGKFNLEYHPVIKEDGYIVYIDPIYVPNEDGEQMIVTDDEWCVFINSQNIIINVDYCLSP